MKEKGYTRIKLKTTITNHLELKAKINKVEGNFILDTGASSSCVGLDTAEYFNLFAEDSDVKAAGAGATDMLTQVSLKNELKIIMIASLIFINITSRYFIYYLD